MQRRLLLGLALFLVLALPARPAAPPAAPPYEKWTVDDVVNQEALGSVVFSPDGRFLLWVRYAPDKEKNEQVGQLFRTDRRTGRQVQLTRGPDSCTAPRWSPDGSLIAFLSQRPIKSKGKDDDEAKPDSEPKTQLWLLDATGGEPWNLTESLRGVQQYAWAGNDSLVFIAQEDPGRRESVLKDDKDSTTVVESERHEPPVRLFRIDVKSKKVTRLSDNVDRIELLAVSPDGKRAVTGHGRSLCYTYDNRVKPVFYLYDLADGKHRRVLLDPKLNVEQVRWAPHGKGFYATCSRSSRPELAQAGVTDLYYCDLARGKESRLELGWPRGLYLQAENDYQPGVVPLTDGCLAMLADGVRLRAARFTWQHGKLACRFLQGEHAGQIFGLTATPDGKHVAYAHSTASQPTQWYHARLDGVRLCDPKPLAQLNEALHRRRLARSEVVRWKGANGALVEGLLFYPHGWRPGGPRAPLVVQIHGGPASADQDRWSERWAYAANLFSQRGAFVLKPNYHGSAGYGLAFLEANAGGKYCEPEVQDIEKGVDALIERGLVDPKRLGLQGWSNGAILTNVLITRSNRYRAASAGAGSVEYVSDWASCEFGDAFDRFYLGKSPLEDPHLYQRKSPFYQFARVRTPTLIFFGTEDRIVHPQQGWVQYRALQQLGKTPVRFVLFPGEKHGLRKLSHQRRKLDEEMAWFDRHLFGTAQPASEVIKEDSPLAWLLKRRSAKKVGNRFGISLGGILAPETVSYQGLQVGRFEVTRAQFAAFDPARKVEPGTEDHPVAGVTFEQAKAYCAWLSKKTGRRYRLPSQMEAEELYEKPEPGENTLDAWAGYTVNPDDAQALRVQLAELPEGALVRPVGSGRGAGKEEMVFDLGGNVAEWVTTRDGKGALRGGSADRPADPRGSRLEAGPAYRGFRVVRD